MKRAIGLAVVGFLGVVLTQSPALAQEADSLDVYVGVLESAPNRKVDREWWIGLPKLELCPAFDEDIKSYAVQIPTSSTGVTIVVEPGFQSGLDGLGATTPGGADVKRVHWRVEDGPFDKRDVLIVDGFEAGKSTVRLGYASVFGRVAYELHVTRASVQTSGASMACLSLLGVALSPPFDLGRRSYTAAVGPEVRGVVLAPVAGAGVDIEVSGTNSEGRPLSARGFMISNLTPGRNKVRVTVTAPDGTPGGEYSIEVTRAAPSSDALLTRMTVGVRGVGGEVYRMAPSFKGRTGSYAVTVPHELDQVAVKTSPPLDSKVDFSAVTEGGIHLRAAPSLTIDGMVINGERRPNTANGIVSNLSVGRNVVTVRVTAEDGVTVKTYKVTVTRRP